MAMLQRFSQRMAQQPMPLLGVSSRSLGPNILSSTSFAPTAVSTRLCLQLHPSTFYRRGVATHVKKREAPQVVEVHYDDLKKMTPIAVNRLREAFMGPKAYGAIAVKGIPGYGEKRRRAFRAGIDLALTDPEGRAKAAAVNNTYPGWSGTPGSETHPLQSSFLFNVKEEVIRPDGSAPNGVNPYFGKNIFPSTEYREAWVDLATPMHEASLQVLRGCDVLVEVAMGMEGGKWTTDGRSLHDLALEGPALAGRFICYDSAFTREDTLLDDQNETAAPAEKPDEHTVNMRSMAAAMPMEPKQKHAGHAGDGLASMRTHSTPVKSAGHAGDGLASMRTHSTPVKSAGHAGDGLASMRTHSTPVKSAGHAGDGLASMRTHSTPVKSAGHAGDGLASMRTHSTPVKSAGHAGDGLASMRTHSTPVKSAGHAGDGLASMRTHSTPVKSAGHAGDGLASMRTHSTPVKSAGHAGDGLASMRTHSTPVKSAGHAGDGLASMRTHSTPVKSAGHAADGLASMRTHSTPVKSAGHTMPPGGTAFQMMSDATVGTEQNSIRKHSSTVAVTSDPPPPLYDSPEEPKKIYDPPVSSDKGDVGDYWLPWHIDSNFVTIIHKEMYAYESDGSFAPEPEGSGVVFMNEEGDITTLQTPDDDIMILQMGAFAQIYAGGHLTACRHAVTSKAKAGTARFNFCNFWYIPWDTVCDPPAGREELSVNKGWNAMMDESYIGITMKHGFAAFRTFMTSPEARLQFRETESFKELCELLPLPSNKVSKVTTTATPEIVIDVLTDLRCPISYISLLNLDHAIQKLGMDDTTTIRYHPLFLNPNIDKTGESLDVYLSREFGYTKEYARSETYPLRLLGLEAGVNFNPDRRVVNTFDAACVVEMAQEVGKQREMVNVLSRGYFEDAKDISDENVLCDLAEVVGLESDEVRRRLRDVGGSLQQRISASFNGFSAKVEEVPHFMFRERVSGNGVEAAGRRSVENWEVVLESALEKSRFVGMTVQGINGADVRLSEANPTSPISLALSAQHQWAPQAWPYVEEDFSRMDESQDTYMYAEPRFVNHLDESSLARLNSAYQSFFATGPPAPSVLDLCSSWISHFPADMPQESRVVVHGLNERELKANMQASEHLVQDLNDNAILPYEDGSFDFVTNALSVQYLTDPRAVFSEVHRVLRPGGVAIVAFSHRCFIEKSVNVWAKESYDGEGHVHLISRYFQHGPAGGWSNMSSIDVSPAHGDPMWLVTAVKNS